MNGDQLLKIYRRARQQRAAAPPLQRAIGRDIEPITKWDLSQDSTCRDVDTRTVLEADCLRGGIKIFSAKVPYECNAKTICGNTLP